MSGIAGIYFRDGRPVDPADIRAMLAAISSRGPDGTGTWTDGPAGLGHCLLRTTPESLHETQPLAKDGIVITADARLDNRGELVTSLGLDTSPPESISDAELILNAYRKWDEGCAARLLGDFAFAVWDGNRHRLYCAVDHFRIKPVCYFNSREKFIFSSQVSGLLPGNLAPGEINRLRIGALFFQELSEIDNTTSFYKDIFYLQPGSYLVADKDKTRISSYWSVDEIGEFDRNTDEGYRQEFMEILGESVSCRLRSKDRPGIALSGGIDSASVAALAEKDSGNTGKPLITISGVSKNEATSQESGYIRKSLSALGKNPVLFSPREIDKLSSRLVSIIGEFDSPLLTQEIFLLSLYLVARNNECRVLLDGSEGDTLLGVGEHYISHLFRKFKIQKACNEARAWASNTVDNPGAFFNILLDSMQAAYLPVALRPVAYRARNRIYRGKMIRESAMNPDFAREISLLDNLALVRGSIGYGIMDSVNAMRIRVYKRPFISWSPVTLDMLSSSCGIELRHPYLDKRLVEYSLGLPWDQKARDGWEKFILRNATKNLVPDEIRWRKGRDHTGWEFNDRFITLLYPELQGIVADKTHRIYEFFDYNTIGTLFSREIEDIPFSGKMQLLRLYGLYQWLEKNQ